MVILTNLNICCRMICWFSVRMLVCNLPSDSEIFRKEWPCDSSAISVFPLALFGWLSAWYVYYLQKSDQLIYRPHFRYHFWLIGSYHLSIQICMWQPERSYSLNVHVWFLRTYFCAIAGRAYPCGVPSRVSTFVFASSFHAHGFKGWRVEGIRTLLVQCVLEPQHFINIRISSGRT